MSSPDGYLQADEEEESYKQQLGLKKMLYRYEHENEQLKAQIKALTERLADIKEKKEQQPAPAHPSPEKQNQYRLTLLRQQMKALFTEIERTNIDIKRNKEQINQNQELRCVDLTNSVRKENREIEDFKKEIKKYEKMEHFKHFNLQSVELQQSSVRINTHHDRKKYLEEELQATRKRIRDLERGRDHHDRQAIKKQTYLVNLKEKTRQYESVGKEYPSRTVGPEESKKEKGLWHLEYTEQNYKMIKDELKQLRNQKQKIMDSLKNENIVLKSRFSELSQDAEQFNKSIHLPEIEPPKAIKKSTYGKSNKVSKLNSSLNNSRINSPPRLLNVGPKQFERSNDKNYQPKHLRKMEWQSANFRTNGIEWNDAHLRSPITGMNLWFDGSLVGLQLLQRMAESSQHLHLVTKSISPVQYRLSGNDYLQNVMLWISDNKITGIELISKNGRHDSFGSKSKGRKFDFMIKEPEKPVFSYGRFRITNNISEITKLGFQVI